MVCFFLRKVTVTRLKHNWGETNCKMYSWILKIFTMPILSLSFVCVWLHFFSLCLVISLQYQGASLNVWKPLVEICFLSLSLHYIFSSYLTVDGRESYCPTFVFYGVMSGSKMSQQKTSKSHKNIAMLVLSPTYIIYSSCSPILP